MKVLFISLEVVLSLSLLSDGVQLHLHDNIFPDKTLMYSQRLGLMLQLAVVTAYTLVLLI